MFTLRNYMLALAVVCQSHLSQTESILSDASFYGQSPAVYPSPVGGGIDDWAAAYQKAKTVVAHMSLQEKVNLTSGIPNSVAQNGCIGNTGDLLHLGFRGLCFQDSGQGVHGAELVNGYPSGLHVGASWNKELARQRGHAMGGEFRAKGINVVNGPVPGPLGRVATGGRNWEGFSNDPYLTGALAAITVKAVQERGVITSVKHFIGNEQETNRNPSADSNGSIIAAVSSNLGDRTMHELYLWPWADAVHAGCGSVMCSYQRVNNSYGCANSKILNGLLKTELGFQGFVVSDWNAQHSGVASANAGLDLNMPSVGLWGDQLLSAVNNGSVKVDRLDDMVTRLIATWYQMGQDTEYPGRGIGIPLNIFAPHTPIDARNESTKQIIFDGAVEGHVLVKNVRNALPLRNPGLLALYGYSATVAHHNNPDLAANYELPTSQNPDPSVYAWMLGFESYVYDDAFRGFLRLPYSRNISQIAPKGTIIAGGGGGSINPSYISAPFDALQQKAYESGTALFWDFENNNATGRVIGGTDACLVFINAFASESYDRAGLRDDYSDALVNNIADQCENTIVVVHNAGVRLVDQFADHPNVTAIVFAHVPGQDSGRALVSLLYGDVSFSGKLPYTVPRNESQYTEGTYLPTLPKEPFQYFPQSDFTEELYIDYRSFDERNITPRYEFGFGLSYTTFVYSDLRISISPGALLSPYPLGKVGQGGQVDLWDVTAIVECNVRNSGTVTGAEVAQVYVGIPGGPLKQLRGFEKFTLRPDSITTVKFSLLRRDLSIWDVDAQKWLLQQGDYRIYVGASSRNLALAGVLAI